MASMLQIPKEEYHRFMDFLRRSQCLLDFRPYRKLTKRSRINSNLAGQCAACSLSLAS